MSHEIAEKLISQLQSLDSVAVAFSGGVDSSVVAKAARLALGDDAVAITACSASLPSGEMANSRKIAEQIGIRQEIIHTQELSQEGYVANTGDRCFWCKGELYRRIDTIRNLLGMRFIANGTNLDDLGDYRPGLAAAADRGVVSPLVECHLTKQMVRDVAKYWQLTNWNKPAGPCLASRIAPGVKVTEARLSMIDQAEIILRDLGFQSVRVRLHADDLARIEVDPSQLDRLANPDVRSKINQGLGDLGFRFVTIDLEGFRSGSMNALIKLDPATG